MKQFICAGIILCLMTVYAAIDRACARDMAGIVTKINGELTIMPAGTQTWRKARVGQFLSEGDRLKTGRESTAGIAFVNGIELTINKDTVFDVQGMEGVSTGHAVYMDAGEIYSKVIVRGVTFEMRTPTAVAAVRGTEFNTRMAPNGVMLVEVYKGNVYVHNDHGSVQVGESQKTVVNSGSAPESPTQAEQQPQWQTDEEDKSTLSWSGIPQEAVTDTAYMLLIEARRSDQTLDTGARSEVALVSNYADTVFSRDGRQWGSNSVMLRGGKAQVWVKGFQEGAWVITATGARYKSSSAVIQAKLPRKKELHLKFRTPEGEKTIRYKFSR